MTKKKIEREEKMTFRLQALTFFFFLFCTIFDFLVCEVYVNGCWRKGDYLQAQESTVMLG